MNITAVSTVRDEAPIIARTIRHLLTQGVDNFLISEGHSLDTTWEELAAIPEVTAYRQNGPYHQADEMTRLARLADADWIIPFDADEFWIATDRTSIRDVLANLPPNVTKVHAPMYQHLTWDLRVTEPKFLAKVAFRAHPDAHIHWGSHAVDRPGDDTHGVLQVRELQYRDRHHFDQKIEREKRLRSETVIPGEYGTHMRALTEMTPTELDATWAEMQTQPTVYDPI